MSTSVEGNQTPDPGEDRAKWTQFYNELRAERDQLRKELLKMRSEYFYMYFGHGSGFYECPFTTEELHSFVAHEPSISEIIAELGAKSES
jgi:hypothetical protein